MGRHKKRSRIKPKSKPNVFVSIWNAFWASPDISCPKCGSKIVVWYDPLFFAPIRTMQGRRRLRCSECRFIWRPSRSSKSMWDDLKMRF